MGEENKGSGGGTSIDINLGKETDAAVGDVLRALLMRPSVALAELTADALGIAGDWIKRKREINAARGLQEVRRKLEAHNVDMKDITPPKEEEVHLLLMGMSLSDDQKVRDMWAGLFAKALEPNSGVLAERPYISVLQTLSPTDAKIIEFIAFVMCIEKDLKDNRRIFRPKDFSSMTPEEKDELNLTTEENRKLAEKASILIKEKFISYQFDDLPKVAWSENLMRQGVIEKVPINRRHTGILRYSSVSYRSEMQYVEKLGEHIEALSREAVHAASPPDDLLFKQTGNLSVRLTNFGVRLAAACGLL